MPETRAFLPLVLLALAACGGGSTPAHGLAQRVIPGDLGFPTGVAQPGPVDRVNAFPNLSFDRPTKITHAGDGTDRLFVAEQDGVIRVFANHSAATTADVFLDIRPLVSRDGNEEGLLGLAFDPDFASNGRFYVYYSAAGPRRSVVARYTATGNVADPGSAEILLRFDQPFSNHNGGELAFGPDGKLYVASGDGGSGGDPQDNAQDLDTFLGKILRMNPDGSAPADNPFHDGQGGPRDYVWAYGLRNPWRMSFDRATGDLWAGDVGQSAREEIDVIVRGGNYGWRLYEGQLEFNNPAGVPFDDFAAPVLDYGRGLGASVTGGHVYRGSANPSYVGAYVYADFVSGRVWALVREGASVLSNTQIATVSNPSSFGEDEAGELYVCSFDGNVYRFAETGGIDDQAPPSLSRSGLFADLGTLRPAPGLIEYDVNAPFWSDGADKRRWIAVPGTTTIAFDATGPWAFPVGTVLVKHFELAGRRIETRVLVHAADGWDGYSYRWNAEGTDADLVAEGATASVPGPDGPQDWTFPSPAQCARCHTPAAGFVLGVRTDQLNRSFAYPARDDNQLRAWNHIGLFDRDVGDAAQYGALADPYGAGDVESRARAYLDVNCGSCHRPAGPTAVNIDVRATTAEPAMNLFDVLPSDGTLGLLDERRVVAGRKESSTLWERMRRRDAYAMPPLGSHVVDEAGVALIGAWIDSK